MQLPPVAATTIGSFPRPAWLARTERGSAEFILDGVALIEAQEDATLLSIKDQETAGLDLVKQFSERLGVHKSILTFTSVSPSKQ